MLVPRPLYATCALCSTGILSGLGGLAFYSALKLQNAAVVGILRNLDILYAYVLDYLVLDIVPNELSVLGGVVIVAAVIMLFFRDRCSMGCGMKVDKGDGDVEMKAG